MTASHSNKISPSSVYYCPMECEGEKLYFQPGRCSVCNMFLIPIEEKEEYKNKPQTFSKTHLPQNFTNKIGDYFCPMFCEGEKTYSTDIGCPICHMHLEEITDELVTASTPLSYHDHSMDRSNLKTPLSNQAGKYYCPMFCEGDKVYDSNVGCPICGMDLVAVPSENSDDDDQHYQKLKKKFLFALLFTIPVFLLSMARMAIDFPFSYKIQGILELLLTLPVLLYAGWFIMKRGFVSFQTRNLNMFSLITLGVSAAFLFSVVALVAPSIFPIEIAHHGEVPLYFEAVTVILTLVILGQLMEAAAHKKTGNAIKELMNLSPKEANIIINGIEKKVPLIQIKVGDILKVKPGEKIPVDGKITEGNSSINESMITGEPIPVEKNTGEIVTSGTINGNGVFLMRAEKVGDETLLSHIIKMVNDASRSRAPIQKTVDRVSKIFVPSVITIAVLTFILWIIFGEENKLIYAFVNAVAVLIVACPCALGLATPMSLMVGIGKGAKSGILIRNAEALEQMEKVNVLITDKTGTLTEGKPSLDEIFPFDGHHQNILLKMAASLNQNSEHPLSNAVLQAFKNDNSQFEKVGDFENISGKGIKGIIQNKMVLLGNKALLETFKIKVPEKLLQKALQVQEDSKTISYISFGENVLGFLSFSDKIKPTSKAAIEFLQQHHVEIIMMTGDNEHTAKAVANELGIKTYFANQLPEDKLNEIKRLQKQGKIVSMIGDGINDAPALAQSNVGIAMGTGTDVAIESAAITLLKGDILGVAKSKILSRKLLKNIKQNLFFAFIYNILGVPVAAGILYPFFGILLSPMIAALAMSFSSVSVILNSLRLNNAKINIQN